MSERALSTTTAGSSVRYSSDAGGIDEMAEAAVSADSRVGADVPHAMALAATHTHRARQRRAITVSVSVAW
jgi:hypothetical protein